MLMDTLNDIRIGLGHAPKWPNRDYSNVVGLSYIHHVENKIGLFMIKTVRSWNSLAML